MVRIVQGNTVRLQLNLIAVDKWQEAGRWHTKTSANFIDVKKKKNQNNLHDIIKTDILLRSIHLLCGHFEYTKQLLP